MRALLGSATVLSILAAGAGCDGAPPDLPDQVLVDVTVIDGTGAAPMAGQTIEISDGRITALRPSVPDDRATVDVAGSFVTPGLIDAHVHLPRDRGELGAVLADMLGVGITAAREMASTPDHTQFNSVADSIRYTRVHRSALWSGPAFMKNDPRIRDIYAEAGHVPWYLAVTDTTDLEAELRGARESGVTGIKITTDLDASLLGAVAASARAAGMPVWAHAAVFPTRPSDVAASDPDVISHAAFFVWEGAGEMPPAFLGAHPWSPFGPPAPYETVAPDDPRVVAVLETMRDRGTILDPTITLMALLSEEAREWAADLTRLAHEMGIPVAAGTDASSISLFEEIEALVDEVGLSPLEALASATSVGAAVVGMEDELGSVRVGKVADLVVYPVDPTSDITALRRPSHVIRSGEVVPTRPTDEG